MNKANECTCPSGDGSLVHPCPAHPAVEQAGGDERAADAKPCATRCPDCGEHDLMPGDLCACGYETDPATGYACSECDGSGEGCVGEVCRECDGSGWFVTPDQARAALAQPSPAQAEQAEAERPEVVAYADPVAFATFKERGHEGGVAGREWMWAEPGAALVAMSRTDECERIVGELRADRDSWAEQAEQRLADWDEMRKERDAALARVAELERQEPVATVAKVPGEDWNSLDFHRDLQHMQPGTKLYAAPVAQAQQLNDLDKQCRDDVARALGLRPNQERGFAWSYLLASIKSCVKASGDSAQAQHSVPETTNEEANSFLRVADAGQFKDNAAAVRTAAMIIRGLLHSPAIMKSIIRHRIGLTPEYEGQWHADLYGEDGEVQHHAEADTPDEAVRAVVALAAAPGKEGV
ncbi:hypothetical protein KUT58_18415 [Pseudomonas aeruginosa]|nr:hypothetical protein [Pseudomonas aeruginosa]